MTPNIVKGNNSLPADRYDDPKHPRNNPAFQPDSLKQRDVHAESIYDDAKQTDGTGTKEASQGASVFDAKEGSIGTAFAKDGTIGQLGEKVGGPLASDGAIGKNFNPDGAIGGTFQQLANKNQER